MKILLTTIGSLGVIFSLDMSQTAKATTEQNFLPNIHFVRGGGHVGGHDFRGRDEGGGDATAAGRSAADSSAETTADRVHTLDNKGLNDLRNDEGWLGDEGLGGVPGCAEVDANGNCISYQPN